MGKKEEDEEGKEDKEMGRWGGGGGKGTQLGWRGKRVKSEEVKSAAWDYMPDTH